MAEIWSKNIMVVRMFEFLESITDFFTQFGWWGFFGYILVYGGLFWIGIELKSKGFFENKLFRWIHGILIGVCLYLAWCILGRILPINMSDFVYGSIFGILEGLTIAIAWEIVGIVALILTLGTSFGIGDIRWYGGIHIVVEIILGILGVIILKLQKD